MRQGGGNSMTQVSRRTLLRQLAAACAALPLVPCAVRAQSAPLKTLRWSEGLLVVQGPNANSLAVDGADGVVLVGGGHAAWSDALLASVADNFRGRPLRALVNTHWHEEQTGANRRVGEQGATIVAHENTKLWLGSEVWVRWSDKKYPPLPKAAQPTTTFYESTDAELGGRRVRYIYTPKAHTDGDTFVQFVKANVIMTGDFFRSIQYPNIDRTNGGSLPGLIAALDAVIEAAGPATKILPGHGPVVDVSAVKAHRDMVVALRDKVDKLIKEGKTQEQVVAAKPTADYDAKVQQPGTTADRFVGQLYAELKK